MLDELWKYVKANFNKRLLLYLTIVMSMALLGTPLLPNILVKLVSFLCLLAASGFFIPVFLSQFASRLKLLLAHRNRVKIPVTEEIADLSKRMGVSIKEVGIVKGCTAYVIGRTLVLGLELLRRLTFERRQAVVAHELGHIKGRHGLWGFLVLSMIVAVPCYSWSNLYLPALFLEAPFNLLLNAIVNVALLAFAMMAFIPVSWHLETRADKAAAKFAGAANIKSALLAIAEDKDLEEPSETHPSIAERIRRIDKLNL